MHSPYLHPLNLCGRLLILASCLLACDPNTFYQTQEMSLDLNGCIDNEVCQQSLFSQMTLGCYVTQERSEQALVRRNRFQVDTDGQLVFDETLLSQEVGDRFIGALFFLNSAAESCVGITPNTACEDGCLLRLKHEEVTVGNELTIIRFSDELSCELESNNSDILNACLETTVLDMDEIDMISPDMNDVDMGDVDMGDVDMTDVDMGGCLPSLIGTNCVSEGVGLCGSGIYQCQDQSLICLANQPAFEDCDTIDNDCDGRIDEELGGESCTLGLGACETSGMIACFAGNLSCQVDNMPSPANRDQVCDGVDNDCDGQIDEDYQQSVINCGLGACAASGTTYCVNGEEVNDCIALPAGPELGDVCDGVDSDCDGNTDEAHQVSNTQCGQGVCAATGQRLCQSGQVVNTCTQGTPGAGELDVSCNQIDDDCDGSFDEGYTGGVTTCGQGVCAATGQLSCQNGLILNSCVVQAVTNPNDTLCDGLDGDCDGNTDEGYTNSVSECGDGVCQRFGELSCLNGSVNDSCQVGQPTRLTDENCNGVDENCNGEVDEDFIPYPSPPCGDGVCQQVGQVTCLNGSLFEDCRPLEAQTTQDANCNNIDEDCDGQSDENYTVTPSSCGIGECASTGEVRCTNGSEVDTCEPISLVGAVPDECDGLDNDCDTEIDEDFAPTVVNCDLVTQCVGGTGETTCLNNQLGSTCDEPANRDSDGDGVGDPCAWVSAPGLSIDVLRHEVTFGAYRDCVASGACANDPINYQVVDQTDPRNGCVYIPNNQISNEPENNPLRCLKADTNIVLGPNEPFEAHQLGEYCAWIGGRLPTADELLLILQNFGPLDCSNSNLGTCPNASNLPQAVCSLEANPNDFEICDLGGNVWEISSDYIVSGTARRIDTCFEHFNNANDSFLNRCGQADESRLGPTIGGRCVRD